MAEVKCDICDEEFDTENQLMQHRAQMHAGESGAGTETRDEDLEEPDMPRAANE